MSVDQTLLCSFQVSHLIVPRWNDELTKWHRRF